MTRTTCRECRDEHVAPCLFQHGGRRRSSSARVYKSSLLCSGFASISGTTSGKNEVDMFIPVNAVATLLNTCRASRACRNERVAICCPTSATQHVTTFPVPKWNNHIACHVVSWRDGRSGIWSLAIKCLCLIIFLHIEMYETEFTFSETEMAINNNYNYIAKIILDSAKNKNKL